LITVNCRIAAAIGAALIGRLCAGDRLSEALSEKLMPVKVAPRATHHPAAASLPGV
jgi:hypothetical protein